MNKLIEWFKSFKKDKWKCYEIHTVQARMYGCNSQCNECKLKQKSKNK